MKTKYKIQFNVTNYLAVFLRYLKRVKACRKWNSDRDYITSRIQSGDYKITGFKWNQLVWQEIDMYIRLMEQVDPNEFSELCNRRGFSNDMRSYLKDMLIHVGLGKELKKYPL